MRALKLSFALTAVVLAGCASLGVGESEFSCNKAPGGVPCTSLQDAYAVTNRTLGDVPKNQDEVRVQMAARNSAAQQSAQPSGGNFFSFLPGRARTQTITESADGQIFVEDGDANRVARPTMEPAKVLRIWIAPWVDDAQTLHWPTHLFTEITPRKWSYGSPVSAQAKPTFFFPAQVDNIRGGRSSLTTPPVGNTPGGFSGMNLQNAAQGIIPGVGGANSGSTANGGSSTPLNGLMQMNK